MRRDIFEYLYDAHWSTRMLLKTWIKLKEMVLGRVREKIRKNISVGEEASLDIRDAGAQPYAELSIEFENRNFSPLQIDGYSIHFSFGRNENTVFKDFFWSRNTISEPPNNVRFGKIPGKGNGTIRIQTMLPYYLYFLNYENYHIFISGRIKLLSDAGYLEYEFNTKANLEREELSNRTVAQQRLVEYFSPFEIRNKE